MKNSVAKQSGLVMPSHYMELDEDEMSYIDGGAWWVVVGWICQGVSLGLSVAAAGISMSDGNNKVVGGLSIASAIMGFVGSVLTGVKTK